MFSKKLSEQSCDCPKGTMEDTDDDIAVIGIGCNFPGGTTSLWHHLKQYWISAFFFSPNVEIFKIIYTQVVVLLYILGEGVDSFWRVLLEAKNCVVDIPAERFDTTLWYDAEGNKPGKMQTTKAALIEGWV